MNEQRTTYRAIWNGAVLAESDQTIELEGNQYFPRDSINPGFFHDSTRKTTCPWKGVAKYYAIEVENETNPNASWYYPNPSPAARLITDHIAFWNGITVERVNGR